jgi:signal transduction histidine kinase
VEAGARLAGNAIERLRAEEHLREDAGRMALAEEVAGFGIWEVDLLRGRLTISAGLAALLGRSGGCLRMGVHELDGAVYPDDLPAVRAIAEKALANREMVQAEFRIVRLNGSLRWMRIQARMEPDGAQPVKITGAAIDITEEKEALLRLEQARGTAERAVRVKDEFVANMSHEIRTPMNGIIGSISLLVDSGVTEEQQEHVDTIRSCGEALLILVNDILDLAKVEAGKLTLEETPFKLEQVVKEALAVVAPAATARGLELRQHLAEDLTQMVVVGDPQRLRQILLNLLSNAVKFTERGHVTVEASLARRSGDLAEVRFDVRDTGIGIPAEVQKAIFQPFTQADSSTTRRYGGTGLGLSICSKLIALMGGKLELKSELGHGSSFSFTARLPITTAAEPPARATECRLPRSLRRLRILVAEDNAVNQKVALRLLEGMGHQGGYGMGWRADGSSGGAN